MKNLMRKELVLAMHPASVLFLLLSAMLLIPIMSFAFTPAWAPFSSA